MDRGGKAFCTILTNSDNEQAVLDGKNNALGYTPKDRRGRTTKISVARMRPTRTGYRLIRDSQYGIRWPTGSVFAFPSREAAEGALREDGRGVGVLVVHEYEPGTSNSTEWAEVPAEPVTTREG